MRICIIAAVLAAPTSALAIPTGPNALGVEIEAPFAYITSYAYSGDGAWMERVGENVRLFRAFGYEAFTNFRTEYDAPGHQFGWEVVISPDDEAVSGSMLMTELYGGAEVLRSDSVTGIASRGGTVELLFGDVTSPHPWVGDTVWMFNSIGVDMSDGIYAALLGEIDASPHPQAFTDSYIAMASVISAPIPPSALLLLGALGALGWLSRPLSSSSPRSRSRPPCSP